jgi:hypothetical protein
MHTLKSMTNSGRRIISYFTVHRAVTFFAIFMLSFAVRTAILIQHRGDILQFGEEPRIAEALLSKGEFADPYVIPTGPTAHSTPFFPVLLAGIYKVLGTGFAGQFGRCMLVVLGYSLLYALYPTFAAAFGFPYEAGMGAGFIAALIPVRRSFEVFRGWEEPWAAMALALVLFLTLKRERTPRPTLASAVWLGLCWGLSLYISFSLFSILAGLLFVEFVSKRTFAVVRDACVILIVTVAVISPWTIRNHNVLHAWTLMRDNLGLEVYYGNHEHARVSAEMNASDPGSLKTFTHPGMSVPEAALVKEMGEISYNRRDLHLAITWIEGHPGNFVLLSIEHFFFFWLGPLNHPFEASVISSYTLLGFAGLGLMRKRVGEIQFRLWCTVLFFYPLMYYIVAFAHRYRVQIDWMIWLSAGLCVMALLEKKPVLQRVNVEQLR